MSPPDEKSGQESRTPGRPSGSNPHNLEARILDSAEQKFGQLGYASASIRMIAKTAEVNPALVHYYFKNKRGLLEAVLDRVLEPAASALAHIRDNSDRQSPDNLNQVVSLMFGMMSEHPNLPRLVTREVLLNEGELRDLFLERFASRLGGALPPMLEAQQLAGTLDRELDPSIMALMVLSLCMFPIIAQPMAEQVLGVNYQHQGLQLIEHHIGALLSGGLSA